MNDNLVGYCGLYCGACYHYRASFPNGQHLLKESSQKGIDPDNFSCKGCLSDKLYIHPGCSQCKIRACAQSKKIPYCGLCEKLPCEILKQFQQDGHKHHLDVFDNLKQLKEMGMEKWIKNQEIRWKCTCGNDFTWHEEICHSCGKTLDSYANK